MRNVMPKMSAHSRTGRGRRGSAHPLTENSAPAAGARGRGSPGSAQGGGERVGSVRPAPVKRLEEELDAALDGVKPPPLYERSVRFAGPAGGHEGDDEDEQSYDGMERSNLNAKRRTRRKTARMARTRMRMPRRPGQN